MSDYSVGDAAVAIGVSPATLRSWERRHGIGPSGRTLGGHRRYTDSDVTALRRMQTLVNSGMPVSAAARVVAVDGIDGADGAEPMHVPHAVAAAWDAATRSLDRRRLALLASRALHRSGAVVAWEELFAPWLRQMGEEWASSGGEGVEREHLASEAIQSAFVAYTARFLPRTAAVRVLTAAMPDEQHVLPMHALSAALAERGVASYVLPCLPERALHGAVERLGVRAVALYAHAPELADATAAARLAERVPLVCTGGSGWSRPPEPIAHAGDLRSALAIMTSGPRGRGATGP